MPTRSDTTAVEPTRTLREVKAWRNAVFVVFALSGIALSSWVARIPGVRDGLRLDTAQVGLLLFCLSAGSILGLATAAPLLARVGARRGIALALITVSVGIALVAMGVSFVPFVPLVAVGLALLGLGNGSCDVMMNVEAAAAERELGKTIMPMMHGLFSIGTVIGAAVGAAAAALGIPVGWHLVTIAVVIAAVGVAVVRWLPHSHALGDTATLGAAKPGWRARLRDNLSVWADWRLILIGVVMLGMAFTEGSANDWIALATVDGHHQDNATGAFVFGVFVAAMTVGRIAGGPLVDRIGRVAAIRATAVLGIVGLLVFILGGPFWLVCAGTVLWGFGASLGFPLGMSAAADDSARAAARVSAVAMIGYLAFLAGPPLIGFLGQSFGILNALYVVLALLVMSALASGAVRKRDA